MRRSVGVSCVHACMYIRLCVSVCVCESIYDTGTLLGYCGCERPQHLSLLWNRGRQQRDNAAVLSNTHIQYSVYIQTGCEGKIISTYIHTGWNMVALLTLYENHVLWMVTFDYCKKYFHIFALYPLWFFLNSNTWFLRSAHFFLTCNCTATTFLLVHWYSAEDLLTFTGLAVWLVNIVPMRNNRVD